MLVALPVLGLAIGWSVHQESNPCAGWGSFAATSGTGPGTRRVGASTKRNGPMLAALNDLLQRIGVLMQSERRFTADAAHELRTPIAAIRAQAEVALHEKREDARQHALQSHATGL